MLCVTSLSGSNVEKAISSVKTLLVCHDVGRSETMLCEVGQNANLDENAEGIRGGGLGGGVCACAVCKCTTCRDGMCPVLNRYTRHE